MTNSWAPIKASSDPTQKLVRGRGLKSIQGPACDLLGFKKKRNNFIKITLNYSLAEHRW